MNNNQGNNNNNSLLILLLVVLGAYFVWQNPGILKIPSIPQPVVQTVVVPLPVPQLPKPGPSPTPTQELHLNMTAIPEVTRTPGPSDDLKHIEPTLMPTAYTGFWSKVDVLGFGSALKEKTIKREVDLGLVYQIEKAVGMGMYGTEIKNIFGTTIDRNCVAAFAQGNWYAGTTGRLTDMTEFKVTKSHKVDLPAPEANANPASKLEAEVVDEVYIKIPLGIFGFQDPLNPNNAIAPDQAAPTPNALGVETGYNLSFHTVTGFSSGINLIADLITSARTGTSFVNRNNDLSYTRAAVIAKWDSFYNFSTRGESLLKNLSDGVISQYGYNRETGKYGPKFNELWIAVNEVAKSSGYYPIDKNQIIRPADPTAPEGDPRREDLVLYVPRESIVLDLKGPYYLETLNSDPIPFNPPDVGQLESGSDPVCRVSQFDTQKVTELLNAYKSGQVK